MTEKNTLQEIFKKSAGGPCDFLEPDELISLIPDASAISVTTEVRGKLHEGRRFAKSIRKMFENQEITTAEINELLDKGLLTKNQTNYILNTN